MSRRQRIANLAIAAVIAVVAAVVILASSGDDGEGGPDRTAATPVPVETRGAGGRQRATPTPTPTPTAEPVPEIVVRDGAVRGGLRTIRVDEGDRVRFSVVSDVPEEIHVHAYDIYRDLEPGRPARLNFPATITGVIEVELHGAGLPIAELRVEP